MVAHIHVREHVLVVAQADAQEAVPEVVLDVVEVVLVLAQVDAPEHVLAHVQVQTINFRNKSLKTCFLGCF